MFAALLPVLGPLLGQITKKFFPNPEDELKRLQIEKDFQQALMDNATKLELAAADIVKAEAQGNALQRNWRPVLMLVFAALIVARWFGWSASNLPAAEYMELWSIVKLGIGGYIIGRSVEKAAPSVADIFNKNKGE